MESSSSRGSMQIAQLSPGFWREREGRWVEGVIVWILSRVLEVLGMEIVSGDFSDWREGEGGGFVCCISDGGGSELVWFVGVFVDVFMVLSVVLDVCGVVSSIVGCCSDGGGVPALDSGGL
jgi:hypothetical protein